MKLKNSIILIVVFLFILASCSEDSEVANVDLNFTLTFEDNALVAFNELQYPRGYPVFFTKYSLFLSDITLHGAEGEYVLSNVEFIDLLTDVVTQQEAMNGKTISFNDVPAGTYNSISFNIGVPPEVNRTVPAEYDPDHPLSNNGEYWVGWSSYIFHKIEGQMDSDGDNVLDAGIALHIGSDEAFRSLRIDREIIIDEGSEEIGISFDLSDILNLDGAGNYYDFLDTPQIHHLGVLPKALPILDNTINGISVTQEL